MYVLTEVTSLPRVLKRTQSHEFTLLIISGFTMSQNETIVNKARLVERYYSVVNLILTKI